MAMRKWLWPNCREVILPGVSGGVVIIGFVIMHGALRGGDECLEPLGMCPAPVHLAAAAAT
jgi:hypothetical protein